MGNKNNPTRVIAEQQLLIVLTQRNYYVETGDETTADHKHLLLYYAIERNEDIDKIEISSLKQWVRERSTNSEATPTKPND